MTPSKSGHPEFLNEWINQFGMLSLKGIMYTICWTPWQEECKKKDMPAFKHLEYIMSSKNEFFHFYSSKDYVSEF